MISNYALCEEDIRSLALRDFSCEDRTSFLVCNSGGIGDVFLAVEIVLALKEMPRIKALKASEWILTVPSDHLEVCRTFLETTGVFDKIAGDEYFNSLPYVHTRYHPHVLNFLLKDTLVDAHVALGTTLDFTWARWGLPGKFKLAPKGHVLRRLRKAVAPIRPEGLLSLADPLGPYYVCSMSSSSYSNLKKWPAQEWNRLISTLR